MADRNAIRLTPLDAPSIRLTPPDANRSQTSVLEPPPPLPSFDTMRPANSEPLLLNPPPQSIQTWLPDAPPTPEPIIRPEISNRERWNKDIDDWISAPHQMDPELRASIGFAAKSLLFAAPTSPGELAMDITAGYGASKAIPIVRSLLGKIPIEVLQRSPGAVLDSIAQRMVSPNAARYVEPTIHPEPLYPGRFSPYGKKPIPDPILYNAPPNVPPPAPVTPPPVVPLPAAQVAQPAQGPVQGPQTYENQLLTNAPGPATSMVPLQPSQAAAIPATPVPAVPSGAPAVRLPGFRDWFVKKGKAAGLHVDKLATPEEQAAADIILERINPLRKKTLHVKESWDQTRASGEILGWNQETALKAIDSGRPFNSQEKAALGSVIANASKRLNDLLEAIAVTTDRTELAILKNARAEQILDMEKMFKQLTINTSTTAKDLNYAKSMLRKFNDDKAKLLRSLQKYPQDVRDFVIDRLNAVNWEKGEVSKELEKLKGWSLRDVFVEFATTNKLTTAVTYVVNDLTQGMMGVQGVVERGLAGMTDKALDPVLTKLYGVGRQRWAREIGFELSGIWQGMQMASRHMTKIMASGDMAALNQLMESKGYSTSAAIKGRPGRDAMLDRFLDWWGPKQRSPYYLLAMNDLFFYEAFYQGGIHVYAFREAMKAGLQPGTLAFGRKVVKILKDPSTIEGLMDAADREALFKIFQEDPGKVTEAIMRFAHDTLPELRLVIPFIKIAPTLQKMAYRMTPAPLLTDTAPSVWKAATKQLGGPAERAIERGRMVDSLARMEAGMIAMIPMAYAAYKGRITMGAPTDPYEKDYFYASGRIPYMFHIGDSGFGYLRIQPWASLAVGNALIAEAIRNKDAKAADTQTALLATTLTQFVTDQTFFQNLDNLFDAMSSGGLTAWGKFISSVGTGALIPTGIGGLARGFDQTIRKPGSVAESFESKMPIMSKDTTPMIGIFGDEFKRPHGMIGTNLNPIPYTKIVSPPAHDFLKSFGQRVAVGGDMEDNVRASFFPKQILGITIPKDIYVKAVKSTGPQIKQWILEAKRLSEMTPVVKLGAEEIQKELSKVEKETRDPWLRVFVDLDPALATLDFTIPKVVKDIMEKYAVMPLNPAIKEVFWPSMLAQYDVVIDPKTIPDSAYPHLFKILQEEALANTSNHQIRKSSFTAIIEAQQLRAKDSMANLQAR